MPRRDGTGPVGKGPKTGWGLGRCRNADVTPPERDNQTDSNPANNAAPDGSVGSGPAGRGPGLGRGRGRGFGPGGGAGRGPGRGQGRGRG